MKPTHVFSHEIFGSVASWPVSVSLSRNERTKNWTLYLNYTDPENSQREVVRCGDAASVVEALEQYGIDADDFCASLDNAELDALMQLAEEIRQLPTRD